MKAKSFLESLSYAVDGLKQVAKRERNMRIHLLVAVFVLVMSLLLKINKGEFLVILITTGAVLAIEVINTAFEALCDLISPHYDQRIKLAKNAAAGAVLLVAIFALIVGLFIFGPYLYQLLLKLV